MKLADFRRLMTTKSFFFLRIISHNYNITAMRKTYLNLRIRYAHLSNVIWTAIGIIGLAAMMIGFILGAN